MTTKRTRRQFIQLSAAGAAGALLLSQYSCGSGASKSTSVPWSEWIKKAGGEIGLQLYTIRDQMAADVQGTLKQVAGMGYKYMELAGYSDGKFYGYEPAEFKKIVEDLGMIVLSSHTQVEAAGITSENAKKMADDHAKLGVKFCVQPWVVEEARTTVASYQKMVADWNLVGKIMKESGIQFAYHNHNFEFGTVEGKVPYFDVLMAELDKDMVTLELDMFWASKAGQNPVELIKKYPGRFQLFHMKDMFTNQPPFFDVTKDDIAPVGAGVIDFKAILEARDIAGMKYFIVEQDQSRENRIMEDIKTSITNLKTKILV